MITTKDIQGPNKPDETDKVFVTLHANNGASAKYSLFALNLKQVPDKLEHQGRVYERKEGNVLVEKAAESAEPLRPVREAPADMRLPVEKSKKK